MTSYLFGDILAVSKIDLFLTFILDFIVLCLVALLYNYLRAYLFDEEFATVLKIKTRLFDHLLYALIALTIVILIRAVGIILVIALLTAPPAIARLFSNDLKTIMISATLISLVSCLVGLWLSYNFHIASGASIVLFSALLYFASYIVKNILQQRKLHNKNQGIS